MDADKLIEEHSLVAIEPQINPPVNKDAHDFMIGEGWVQAQIPADTIYVERDKFNFDKAIAYKHDAAKVLVIVSKDDIAICCLMTGSLKTFHVDELKVIMDVMRTS